MTEEEMLEKIAELTTTNEELTKNLEELNKSNEELKGRLDKANLVSQELISRYALKTSEQPLNQTPTKSLEDRLNDIINRKEN